MQNKCTDNTLLSDTKHQTMMLDALYNEILSVSADDYTVNKIPISIGGGRKIFFHSSILRATWPLFAEISSSLQLISDEVELIFPGVSLEEIYAFRDLIYTGVCYRSTEMEDKYLISFLNNIGVRWNLLVKRFKNMLPQGEEIKRSVSHKLSLDTLKGASDNYQAVDEFNILNKDLSLQYVSEEYNEPVAIPFENFVRIQSSDSTSNPTLTRHEEDWLAQNSDIPFQNCIEPTHFFSGDDVSIGQFIINKEEDKCDRYCSQNCSEAISHWTEDVHNKVRSMFYSETGAVDVKNKLLTHLRCQSHICPAATNYYMINGHVFCLKFLSSLLGISKYLLKTVLVDFWNGRTMYQHGNIGSLKSLPLGVMNFVCWMKQFALHYGQFSPDSNTIVLCYWLNRRYLYNLYVEETEGPHISLSSFYEQFKKWFSFNRWDKSLPHIVISKYSSHSVCNQCVALNTARMQARTEAELRRVTEAGNHHKRIYGEARRVIQEIKQSALSYPSDNLFIQV